MLKADNADCQYLSISRKKHHSVCSERGGRYIYHSTSEKGSMNKKYLRNLCYKLQAIGGDFTNVNTGWEGGSIHWVR